EWLGGYYEDKFSCNPMWAPEFQDFPKHPITNGVKPFSIKDEWYIHMRFRDDMENITPLLSAVVPDDVRDGPYVYPKGPYPHIQADKGKNASETMMWATERADGGRGVGFTGGHFHQNWGEPNYRRIVLNALLWISKVDVPAGGVDSVVTADDLTKNLDPKGKK
ncbi:MAG: ThuA domain-containing protein, partial [Fimbriiglobus sp.]